MFLFSVSHTFIYFVVCLTTCPYHLPKQVFHKVQSSASSFSWQYPFFSLRSSCSYLYLIFPSPLFFPLSFIQQYSYTRCDQSSWLYLMFSCAFTLRFEFCAFWSINLSMTKLIKKSAVDSLLYFLYPRIKLMLYLSHSHIQGFNTNMCGAKIVRSV